MQFERDLSSFLTCRYEEMAIGGRMILTFRGRNGDPALKENCYEWELLAQALRGMAYEVSFNLFTFKEILTILFPSVMGYRICMP